MNANLNKTATINAATQFRTDILKDPTLGGIVTVPRILTIFNRISHKQIDEKLFKARFEENWFFWKAVLTLAKTIIPSRKIRAIINALITFGDEVLN